MGKGLRRAYDDDDDNGRKMENVSGQQFGVHENYTFIGWFGMAI